MIPGSSDATGAICSGRRWWRAVSPPVPPIPYPDLIHQPCDQGASESARLREFTEATGQRSTRGAELRAGSAAESAPDREHRVRGSRIARAAMHQRLRPVMKRADWHVSEASSVSSGRPPRGRFAATSAWREHWSRAVASCARSARTAPRAQCTLAARSPSMEGSDDVIVDKFSISRGGKTLFRDSRLALVHGRRYGLIGALACQRAAAALELSMWPASCRPKRLR